MTVRLLIGDCRERLAELEAGSVHCCVTSPPYFGLRDYGTGQWAQGDDSCDHVAGAKRYGSKSETAAGQIRGGPFRDECGKCGAIRIDRQMGLEATPDEFVAGMVAVFAEVRRVLRDDGTLWLNIGDSYATQGGQQKTPHMGAIFADRARGQNVISRGKRLPRGEGRWGGGNNAAGGDLKPKDLIGIPWLLAFALRADGWYLRQDIIWSKPNPMPESVRDRCTKAHEYLFLLSKSPKYYFDADAIKEPSSDLEASTARYKSSFGGAKNEHLLASNQVHTRPIGMREFDGTRNKRSVWEVTTQPFSEAHFATFPPDLIEPCILAGCPVGGTVLDPFGGAGTTGLVADRLQRNAILIELNPAYAEMARRRIDNDRGGLLDAMEAA